MIRRLPLIICLLITAYFDPANAQDACAPPSRLVSFEPLLVVEGPARHGTDRRIEPFSLMLMQSAAAWRGHRDAAVAEYAVGQMLRWAQAGALSEIATAGEDESNTNSIYSLRRALIAILGAWIDLRPSPAGQAAAAGIEPWLKQLVILQDVRTGGAPSRSRGQATSNHNNHVLLRATIDAQWSTISKERSMAPRAYDTARAMLDDMRYDGSLPRETARGSRALWYQRHAIASLLYIAELLWPQGYDLWQARADGVDLHRGVAFLVNALKDPLVLAPYAGEAATHQDLGFLEVRGSGRNYMAWAVLYRARFPDRPEAVALGQLLPHTGEPGWPLVDDYVGGNTTCRIATP